MKALQDRLLAYSNDSITNPQAGIAPIRQAGLDNINRSYMDVPTRLSSQFASRGYGSSGDFGSSLARNEYQRGGAISGFEGQLAEMANSQRNYGASLGEQLLQSGRGSTTTGTGSGNGAASGFLSGGSALSNISLLATLSKLLKGGGGTLSTGGGPGDGQGDGYG